MKVGILSDTHVPQRGKEIPVQIYDIFKGVDLILHAGDLTELIVIDQLRQITTNIEAVIGNMDPALNQKILPLKRLIRVEGITIGLIHGWGSPVGIHDKIWNEFRDKRPNIIVFGHTHQPERSIHFNTTFLNPGTPMSSDNFSNTATVILMKIENKEVNIDFVNLKAIKGRQ